MTWADKLYQIRKLSEFEILCEYRQWRISVHDAHYGQYGIPNGYLSFFDRYDSMEEAVDGWWQRHVEDIPHDRCILVAKFRQAARYVRWNGSDWIDSNRGWY